jgi:hypothetical protein
MWPRSAEIERGRRVVMRVGGRVDRRGAAGRRGVEEDDRVEADAGQAVAVRIVAHPVAGRVGVAAARDARSAADRRAAAAERRGQDRGRVEHVARAAVVDRDVVDDACPGQRREIDRTVVVGVEVDAVAEAGARGRRALDEEQRRAAVSERAAV